MVVVTLLSLLALLCYDTKFPQILLLMQLKITKNKQVINARETTESKHTENECNKEGNTDENKTQNEVWLILWKTPTHSAGIHFQGKSAYVQEKQK